MGGEVQGSSWNGAVMEPGNTHCCENLENLQLPDFMYSFGNFQHFVGSLLVQHASRNYYGEKVYSSYI